MTTEKELQEIFNIIFEESGLNQQKFAKKIKVSAQYIGQIQNGKVNLTLKQLRKIAKKCDKDIEILLKDAGL